MVLSASTVLINGYGHEPVAQQRQEKEAPTNAERTTTPVILSTTTPVILSTTTPVILSARRSACPGFQGDLPQDGAQEGWLHLPLPVAGTWQVHIHLGLWGKEAPALGAVPPVLNDLLE